MDISSKQFDEIQIQWRKSVRYLLNLHPRTHNAMLPHITGSPSPKAMIHSRILCFMKRGLQHKDEYISFFFKNCVTNLHSYMSRNMNIILGQLSISHATMLRRSEAWLKARCKDEQAPDWKAKMAKELIQCRDGALECNLSPEELKQILNHLCTEWCMWFMYKSCTKHNECKELFYVLNC